jgi:glutathione synthase/RimK-type ligase-like ATP-grasp enzyme
MGMRTIYALTDYKGYFGSKHNAVPYNSGMDKKLLVKYFLEFDIEVVFMLFSEVINYSNDFWRNKILIYTSSEDTGYYYKNFIEDIVYYLELSDAVVIPPFKYLRANNNKVFMELLRNQINNDNFHIRSKVFGCFEEAEKISGVSNFPLVYKQAAGAMSEGVGSIKDQAGFNKKLKKLSRTSNLFRELWEYGRSIKYEGYIRESKYRNKFIIQDFIKGLNGDYKVLIFGDKFYVLQRHVKKGDFRASGSGIRNFVKEIPQGLLEYAYLCAKSLNVPNVSIDIGYNGESFFLIEFQCLYFGSYTLTYSDLYWSKTGNDKFELKEGKSVLEEEYVNSIVKYCINNENVFFK